MDPNEKIGRWTFPDGSPLPPPKERSLHPQLPVPPFVVIDGVLCQLEYVKIGDLPRWTNRHNLVHSRTAWMGERRLGSVEVYWPRNGNEEEA